MRILLWVIVALNQCILVLESCVQFRRLTVSEFAFKEYLTSQTGSSAKLLSVAYSKLPFLQTLRWSVLVLSATFSVALVSYLVDPIYFSVALVLLSFLVTAAIARLSFMQSLADNLLEKSIKYRLRVIDILHPVLRVIGSTQRPPLPLASSKDEFINQLRRLPSTVLSPIERQRLENVIMSDKKTARDIMTAKRQVTTVEPSAVLGPVILSDLQKSGHGYFPVMTKKTEPEGVLSLGELSDINLAKKRSTVRDLMSQHIAWVDIDAPLEHVVDSFLKEKQYIIFVRGVDDSFSGIVTVADLIKQLFTVAKSGPR